MGVGGEPTSSRNPSIRMPFCHEACCTKHAFCHPTTPTPLPLSNHPSLISSLSSPKPCEADLVQHARQRQRLCHFRGVSLLARAEYGFSGSPPPSQPVRDGTHYRMGPREAGVEVGWGWGCRLWGRGPHRFLHSDFGGFDDVLLLEPKPGPAVQTQSLAMCTFKVHP